MFITIADEEGHGIRIRADSIVAIEDIHGDEIGSLVRLSNGVTLSSSMTAKQIEELIDPQTDPNILLQEQRTAAFIKRLESGDSLFTG